MLENCMERCGFKDLHGDLKWIEFNMEIGQELVVGKEKIVDAYLACLSACRDLARCKSSEWMGLAKVGLLFYGTFFTVKAMSSFYATKNKAGLTFTALAVTSFFGSFLADVMYTRRCSSEDWRGTFNNTNLDIF